MKKLYKHPWIIVAVIALITIFFGIQLPKAELDNNNLRFVPKNDPALEISRKIDENFGSSFFILIGLERPYGSVFDREFLNRIREFERVVKEINIVREVTSLISADYINSDGDAIVAEKLINDNFSGTVQEIDELKRRLLSWDMYERALFSDDFTATQILIPLTIDADEATSKEINEKFLHIRDIAQEMFSELATVYVTGMPIIAATVNEAMSADLKLLVPLVILVALLVLFFSFRRFAYVALPLLTVLIATIWSVGAMPIFGIKLSVISTVLPVILTAVGSAYGIHVVTHYLAANSAADRDMNREEHCELVLAVIMKIRKPVFLAALTTFAAFVSFCFTSVAPCREFGYFSSFGVAAAFSIAITLIPALLIIRGPKPVKNRKSKQSTNSMDTFLADSLLGISQHKKMIVFVTVLIGIFSLYGLSKLIIDNVMVEYFKTSTDIYKSDTFIRRQFGGSKVVSIMIEADSSDIILRPDTLAAMDGLSQFLEKKVPNVGKVMGFTNLVKRINQVFNADESPDGIQPGYQAKSSDQESGFGDFGFGFEDDTEEGDFGFSTLNFDGINDDYISAAPPGSSPERIYTESALMDLFDHAGNRFGGMNANELIWELKRQTNYEGASYYEIPVEPRRYGKETPQELQRLISNYLVLLSGNIGDYANDSLEPTAIKATVQLRTLGMDDSEKIFREIDRYIAANFPSDVTVTVGGTTMVEKSLNSLVVQSQLISMFFSIICVFIIVAVSNKSLIAGCIGIAPLSISVLLNFAVMGFTGIKLNLGTSMVASVSVGVGIDYTIHCLEAYKREYRASNGQGDFLRRTFISSGKAIVINAVSVGAGFAVLIMSSFVMLGDLGLLITLTMFSSAAVSLIVLPALLALIKPKFIVEQAAD